MMALNPTSPLSPVAFARDYQRYRNEATRVPYADTRLLLAARFWSARGAALSDSSYDSYSKEDLPPLLSRVPATSWEDMRPAELAEIAKFLDMLSDELAGNLDTRPIWEESARKWLYLGEVRPALDALAQIETFGINRTSEITQILERTQFESATELPPLLANATESTHPELARWLLNFEASCQAIRESGDSRRANCLLVEYDTTGQPTRGRVRTLEGRIEILKRDAQTDEVVFGHQVRAADDPQVTGVYAALAALRRTYGSRSLIHRSVRRSTSGEGPADCHSEERSDEEPAVRPRRNGRIEKQILRPPRRTQDDNRSTLEPTEDAKLGPCLRGSFSFDGPDTETFGGDSLGLASFAIAYGDRWGSELHRERKLIGSSVAFTGAVDADGAVRPVSSESLAIKIERAFCSPLEYVVVPESNRHEAESEVENLRRQHPRRRLRIIGAERIDDILADHNILRPEKVCIGEFAVRTAARYSRSVKVQVPVLLLLLYALVCVIEPKAWVLFDWNPAALRPTKDGFLVLNSDSLVIRKQFVANNLEAASCWWRIGNLDKDNLNEYAFCPKVEESSLGLENARLFVYDDDGSMLFRRDCVVSFEYPGDTSRMLPYTPEAIDFVMSGVTSLILTRVYMSNPARLHLKLWTARGELHGSYVHAGYAGATGIWYLTSGNDSLAFLSYNNRMETSSLFVLPTDTLFGVSPPYSDSELDLSAVVPGNQLVYILFPKSDVNSALHLPYNPPGKLVRESEGCFIATIREVANASYPWGSATVSYYFDAHWRLTKVNCNDVFVAIRNDLIVKEVLPDLDVSAYLEGLRDSVKYWSDSGWIAEAQIRAAEENR